MSNDRRTPRVFQETSELIPMHQGNGSYAFVSPKRSRKLPAVILAEPPNLDFEDDVPTRDIRPVPPCGTPPFGTPFAVVERYRARTEREPEEAPIVIGDLDLLATQPTVELSALPAPTAARRHDPDLCSCAKMLSALAVGVVVVVVDGPVSLGAASLPKGLLSGSESLDDIECTYDGLLWAFRYCPFAGCEIDAQVPIRAQVENMSCCGTMAEAVAHGRVELSDTSRFDQPTARITDHGRNTSFSYCPWCRTEMLDLAIARHKRHRGL